MNYTEFKGLVKKDKIENSYLFLGEEYYLMHECISIVKDKYIESTWETLNFTVLDGEYANFDTLVNACETLPFMSNRKIIILKGINAFIEKEEINSKDEIYKYLETLGDHICLILVDKSNELKKNTKLYRLYNKKSLVVEFTKLKGKDLSLWVENQLKKLVDFTNNIEITKDDIDLILIKSLDNNIFDLLSALSIGDINSSLKIFNEIYLSNEPIQKILFMIARQIRLLLSYKLYKNKGYTDGDIQGKLQIKPYEFSKISSGARNYNIEDLEMSLNSILDVDRKIKTTSTNDKIEMEILLVNLAKKK